VAFLSICKEPSPFALWVASFCTPRTEVPGSEAKAAPRVHPGFQPRETAHPPTRHHRQPLRRL